MKNLTVNLAVIAALGLLPCVRADYEGDLMTVRRQGTQAVKAGELRLEPMFKTVAVTWGSKDIGEVKLECRKGTDGEWKPSECPARFFGEADNYRGMVWNLEEGTAYQLRLVNGGKTVAEGSFSTWVENVPVAKTVYLDRNTKFPLTISGRGKPNGWIRYTTRGGETIRAEVGGGALITVEKAANVILEGMTIVAPGAHNVIEIRESEDVRVVNCDISGWSRPARLSMKHNGRNYIDWSREVPRGNGGAGVRIGRGAARTAVERCYIHDPLASSACWRYAHPWGPVAIAMASPAHSTSIRYNDLFGSDQHRWDDVVISAGNFNPTGGFNRTGEVYGNFMLHPGDDNIELDGGQQCIAVYGNRFEGGLCGVSLQGNVISPSYVFSNLFSGQGDTYGTAGQTIKTSGFDCYGMGSYSYVARNLFWGLGSGINVRSINSSVDGALLQRHPELKDWKRPGRASLDVIGNVFCGGQALRGAEANPESVYRDNREGVSLSAEQLPGKLPYRPLAFTLDTVRLNAGADHSPRTIRVLGEPSGRFRVVKNDCFDWFSVKPAEGELKPGMTFTVTFDEEKMKDGPIFRGAFAVRLADGFSRAVSLYVSNPAWRQPIECHQPGDVAVYRKPDECTKDAQGFDVYTFTAPKAGTYFFLVKAKADHHPRGVKVAIDDGEPQEGIFRTSCDFPIWGNVPCPRAVCSIPTWFDLEPGEHKLKLKYRKNACELEAVVMTDHPEAFDPKCEHEEKCDL